jgi:hypothetical protein
VANATAGAVAAAAATESAAAATAADAAAAATATAAAVGQLKRAQAAAATETGATEQSRAEARAIAATYQQGIIHTKQTSRKLSHFQICFHQSKIVAFPDMFSAIIFTIVTAVFSTPWHSVFQRHLFHLFLSSFPGRINAALIAAETAREAVAARVAVLEEKSAAAAATAAQSSSEKSASEKSSEEKSAEEKSVTALRAEIEAVRALAAATAERWAQNETVRCASRHCVCTLSFVFCVELYVFYMCSPLK